MAAISKSNGDLDGAESMLRRALAMKEETLGPEHASTAADLNNLAIVLKEKGDLDGAEQAMRKSLAIKEKSIGANHPSTASTLNNLANLLLSKEELAEAEALFRRALAIREASMDADHPSVLSARAALDVCLRIAERAKTTLIVAGSVMRKVSVSWAPVASLKGPLEVVKADPFLADSELVNGAQLAGRVALVLLGGDCNCAEKVNRAVSHGAVAVLAVNNDEVNPNALFTVRAPLGYFSPVPVMIISLNEGKLIQSMCLTEGLVEFVASPARS